MATIVQDLKYAFRLLIKNPTFTVVVVVTLALGIGLNTAVFSAVDALLLRPLPGARDAGRLVLVYRTWPGGMVYGSNSIPHYRDVRDGTSGVFDGVASWAFTPMNVSVAGKPQRIMGQVVSADYFDVLGVSAERGRTFGPDEGVGRGAHPVVVLSHSGWMSLFGGEADVVGKSLVLDGRQYTVIGVAPKSFHGAMPVVTPMLWAPLMQLDHLQPGFDRFEARGNNFMNIVARLREGVGIEVAQQRVSALAGELREQYPDDYKDSGINLVRQADAGIHPMFRSAQVGLSAVIMAVVGMLLLIACVNVANLLLARARERSREMAVRLSLGARRSVLVRQLLTESVLLAALSGGAGLLVAWWTIGLANRIQFPFDIGFTPDLRVSPLVLLFTLAVSLGTGLLFGLAPALQATRPALVPALKGEAPAGGSRSRMRRGLVIAQMALSIILLVSAGLFLKNLKDATAVDKGFTSDHVLVADVDPGLQGYSRARTEEFYRRVIERLEAMPTVRKVALTNSLPLGLSGSDWGVSIPGYTPAPNEGMSIKMAVVSPGYFETLDIPFLAGRGFTAQDDSASAPGIVVNRRFVERFWPGETGIGRQVRTGGRDHTVIGVVPTGKYERLGEDPLAFMYLVQAQHWETGMNLVIRARADPGSVAPLLRREVAGFDPDLPLANVRAMDDHLGMVLLPARIAGTVLGVFGLLGLGLASVGIYGVMSQSVAAAAAGDRDPGRDRRGRRQRRPAAPGGGPPDGGHRDRDRPRRRVGRSPPAERHPLRQRGGSGHLCRRAHGAGGGRAGGDLDSGPSGGRRESRDRTSTGVTEPGEIPAAAGGRG